MKNLLIPIFMLSSLMISQQAWSQIPMNGLVGYWPMDGNADDLSGNGLNGNFNGSYVSGVSSLSAEFSGLNSLLEIPTNNSFSSDTFSLSFWVYLNSHLAHNEVQLGVIGSSLRWSIGWDPNDVYLIPMTCTGGYGASGNSANSQINTGTWYHLCWVNIGNRTQFYKDGLLVGDTNAAVPIICWDPSMKLYLGGDVGGGAIEYFEGLIDEIGFWNRPLTQQEVENLFNLPNNPRCNSFSGNLLNGLVGYWPFCGNANDESGNGNDGQVSGAILTQDRFGNQNNAYTFNGTADYITVPHSPTLAISDSISISCWVRANQVSTGLTQTLVSKGLQSVFWNYGISLTDLGYPCYTQTNFGAGPLTPLPDTNWHHIAITINQLDNSMALYIDGISIAPLYNVNTNQVITNFSGFIDPCCNENVCFGKNAGGQAFFGGSLDDIAIWNRSLDPNEIRQVFLDGTNGVISPETYLKVKAYPNPINDKLYIQLGELTSTSDYIIRLLDPLGRTLYFSEINQEELTIDMELVHANGFCILVISDDDSKIVFTKKLVVLKNK